MARKVPDPKNPTGLFFAREHRGLSQDQLAEMAGTTKATISKLENGSRELTRLWAERVSAPLKLSAIRIVFWDKVGPPPQAAESEYAIPNAPGWEREPEPARQIATNKAGRSTDLPRKIFTTAANICLKAIIRSRYLGFNAHMLTQNLERSKNILPIK